MHQNVMNLLLVVGTPSKLSSRKRLIKKIMEEWKIDDVPHVSLDEISHSKKAYQNEGAGAQWAY